VDSARAEPADKNTATSATLTMASHERTSELAGERTSHKL
jgi:hypothetical protein